MKPPLGEFFAPPPPFVCERSQRSSIDHGRSLSEGGREDTCEVTSHASRSRMTYRFRNPTLLREMRGGARAGKINKPLGDLCFVPAFLFPCVCCHRVYRTLPHPIHASCIHPLWRLWRSSPSSPSPHLSSLTLTSMPPRTALALTAFTSTGPCLPAQVCNSPAHSLVSLRSLVVN